MRGHPLSRDRESAAGVLGRSPGILTLRWDAGRARLHDSPWQLPGRAAAVGRGTRRDQRGAVSVTTGLVPKHHPKVHPTPAGAPRRRRNRRTTRPAREPSLTGPSSCRGEPADLRMATAPGTDEYRDRPGRCPRHSRPALRSGACRSPHVCWVRLVRGAGPGAAPVADRKPGRRGTTFITAVVHPGPGRNNASPFQGRRNIVP